MTMQSMFIIIVFSMAFVAFFLQEIMGILKKILTIPGAFIVVPLFVLSLLEELFVVPMASIFSAIQIGLIGLEHLLERWLPINMMMILLTRIFLLYLAFLTPLLLGEIQKKRNPLGHADYWGIRIAVALWLFACIALLIA